MRVARLSAAARISREEPHPGVSIKGEGLNSVGYGQILYQKTFSRVLTQRLPVMGLAAK